MRRGLRVLIALPVVLIASACTSPATSTRHTLAPDQGALVGTWTVKRHFSTPEQPFVSFLQDNSWSASDGCDRVYGSWKLSNAGRLSVSESTHATFTCAGAMIPTSVAQGVHVRVTGDSLSLTSSDGTSRTTLERSRTSSVGPQGRPIGYWIAGKTPTSPYLSLRADGTYRAYDSCVTTSGTWTFSNTEQVRLKPASPAPVCTGKNQWLSSADTARSLGDVMTLSNAAGEKIGTLVR